MKTCTVVLSVFSLATAAIGAPYAANAQTEIVKPLKVQPADIVTPVASFFASTPPRGATHQPPDERPVDTSAAPRPTSSLGFFPADVSNPNNQPGITAAQHHPVYVNQPSSHWGNPAGLLRDLGVSDIIHVLDQYTGSYWSNRYTLGDSYQLSYTIAADHTIRRPDLAAIVHAAASVGGSGTGQLYHVFLPQGVDACVASAVCYSPDNPATFTACAWHNAMTFSDIGTVIFTVEPYQNTPLCETSPDHAVNGVLADSTDTTLSHEVFEALSDPTGNGWYVRNSVADGGQEIADLCGLSVVASDGNYYSSDTPVTLGSKKYVVTAIYSDEIHACTYGAGGPAW